MSGLNSYGNREKGLVIVFTGNGKGKTSASLGVALRACGYNMKISVIQFIKGKLYTGELNSSKRLYPNLEIIQCGKGFVKKGDKCSIQRDRDAAIEGLHIAQQRMEDKKTDILILDEINVAVHMGLIPVKNVIYLIESRPYHLHIVLTGRYANQAVINLSDLATEMKEIKHPYRSGGKARKGIDY